MRALAVRWESLAGVASPRLTVARLLCRATTLCQARGSARDTMHFKYEPKSSQIGLWIAVLANSGEAPPPPLATGAVQRRRRSVLFPVPSDLDWTIQSRASLSQTEK